MTARPATHMHLTASGKIQRFGDSTQAGASGGRNTYIPKTSLQAYMNNHFGAGKVTVENRTVGGTTSPKLVTGTDGLPPGQARLMPLG